MQKKSWKFIRYHSLILSMYSCLIHALSIYYSVQPSDWYSITLADLKNIGAPSNLSKVELAEALQERYPDFKWEKVFILRGKFGQQTKLQHMLTQLFPVKILFSFLLAKLNFHMFICFKGEEMLVNARKEADLINPATHQYLELDLFLPSLHLAFEHQVKHNLCSC